MRVLVTAVKNRPSKRASRLRRACSQVRSSGRGGAGGCMQQRLAPGDALDSPFSDINGQAQYQPGWTDWRPVTPVLPFAYSGGNDMRFRQGWWLTVAGFVVLAGSATGRLGLNVDVVA